MNNRHRNPWAFINVTTYGYRFRTLHNLTIHQCKHKVRMPAGNSEALKIELTEARLLGDTKSTKKYQCKFCNYSLKKKSRLDRHVRAHTGEKPYKCTQCDYKSSFMTNLYQHMKTHTQEKPHRCANVIINAYKSHILNST